MQVIAIRPLGIGEEQCSRSGFHMAGCQLGSLGGLPVGQRYVWFTRDKDRSTINCHIVAFRSAKERSFAERKATIICRTIIRRQEPAVSQRHRQCPWATELERLRFRLVDHRIGIRPWFTSYGAGGIRQMVVVRGDAVPSRKLGTETQTSSSHIFRVLPL